MIKILSIALATAVATFGSYAFACKSECPMTGKSVKECSEECRKKCHHKHKVEKVKDFEFSRFFIRPTADKNQPTAAYVTINNTGKVDDKLIAISHPSVHNIEIHNSTVDDKGVMRMEEMKEGIIVKAGEKVALRPRGLHIMINNPDRVFEENTLIPLTLHFEKAGDVMLMFKVKNPRPMHKMHGKHHDKSKMKDGGNCSMGSHGKDTSHKVITPVAPATPVAPMSPMVPSPKAN